MNGNLDALHAWSRVDEGLGEAPPKEDSSGGFWSWLGSELSSGLTSVQESLKKSLASGRETAVSSLQQKIADAQKRTAANMETAARIQDRRGTIFGMDTGRAALYLAGGAAVLTVAVLVLRRGRRR